MVVEYLSKDASFACDKTSVDHESCWVASKLQHLCSFEQPAVVLAEVGCRDSRKLPDRNILASKTGLIYVYFATDEHAVARNYFFRIENIAWN